MKIAYASDLHLEFKEVFLAYDEKPDVLVLAGDICIAARIGKDSVDGKRIKDFFDTVCTVFKHVVYVAGNHEFYSGKLNKTIETLRNLAKEYNNLYFLEQEAVELDGVTFVGGTLWTDVNKNDPLTHQVLATSMNDYKSITNDAAGYTKLRPAHTAAIHTKTRKTFADLVARAIGDVVVVTHHAPSYLSVNKNYAHEYQMNGGYASDLSGFILDRPNVLAWIHGHMHDPVEYTLGGCKVLSNPRGYYGYETAAKLEHKLKAFDA